MKTPLVVLLAAMTGLLGVTAASADTFTFVNITNNDVMDAAIGEAQLSVDVEAEGLAQVRFTFHNTGTDAASVTDVYFDDGTLLGIAQIIDSDDGTGGDAGVDFSPGASPPNLPGGETLTPPFQVTAGFLADSDPAVQANGVNPGETLVIIFDLQSGSTFADVLADLNSGALRIGIHVQGYASGGSESYVNGLNQVGEPGSVGIGALALAALLRIRRR